MSTRDLPQQHGHQARLRSAVRRRRLQHRASPTDLARIVPFSSSTGRRSGWQGAPAIDPCTTYRALDAGVDTGAPDDDVACTACHRGTRLRKSRCAAPLDRSRPRVGRRDSFRPEPWIPQQVAGRWVQRPRPSPRSKWTDRRVRRRRRSRPAGRQHRSHPAKPTPTTTRHSCCQQSLWLPPVVANSCRTVSARSDCDSARAASARRAPATSGARSARQHRQQELLYRHA